MKEFTELEKHYNKFNEDKRLTHRRGYVEFYTSMHYIRECLKMRKEELMSVEPSDKNCKVKQDADADKISVIDIGAGTGRYSIALADEGYDVTAVELVKYNLGILKSKGSSVKAFQGNALKLSRFEDESFDAAVLFGPMYHLYTFEDKLKALKEAKRVTKPGGYIFVAYLMNEYAVLTHGFKENMIKDSIRNGKIDGNFHTQSEASDLYEYVRIEDINALANAASLSRCKLIAADGSANYIRPTLNAMDDETFEIYLKYHLSICERPELLGASAHTVDILRKL